jgi:hypothetical protein
MMLVGLGLRSPGMLGGVVGSCVQPFRDSLSISFSRFRRSKKNAGQRVLTLLRSVGGDLFSARLGNQSRC